MKALVLKEYNYLGYENVPDPEYGSDEVIVGIKACGICGSNVHGMDGSTGRRTVEFINAIYLSQRENKLIKFPLSESKP